MTGTPTGVLTAVAVLAVLVAALLSAGETAVLRLGRSSLAEIDASDRPSARRVRRLMADPHTTAATAAWVRVLCEVVAAVSVTLVLAGAGLSWWQTLVVALVLVGAVALVVLRYGPRTVARRHPLPTARITSGVLVAAQVLARPARALDPAGTQQQELTDEEIRDMVDRVSESEHIEEEEREMFRSVLELGDTITRAVMVPRTEMITLASGTPVDKALSLFLRSGYSRVPVVGESVDDLVGVLYLKDVLRHRHPVASGATAMTPAGASGDHAPAPEVTEKEKVDALVRPPVFVPESKPVDELLREMQQGAFHMAMVVDEFGGIAGLVTIEDALEEIVGELTDEHDRTGPEVEVLDEHSYRVPARMPVDELGELFGMELEDADVDTAGGLLAKALGKVPLSGSSAEVDGLVLTADRVEGRRKRVATLVVRRVHPREGDTEPQAPLATAPGAQR